MKKIAIKKQEKLDRWDGGNFNHPLERTKKMKGISAECPSVNSMEYSMGNSLESEREVTVNTILVKGDNDMNERILNDNISLSSCPSSPALLTGGFISFCTYIFLIYFLLILFYFFFFCSVLFYFILFYFIHFI